MPDTFTAPATTYVEYWPAHVTLPSGEVRRLCKVYLTETGLHVFFTRPASGEAPHWSSPINFEKTFPPNPHARAVGVDIETEAGLVTLTPTGGCGCGASLKTWRPTWGRNTQAWPSA
jgi:hypothetical protein